MTHLSCRSVTMLFLRRFGPRNFFRLKIVKGCEVIKEFLCVLMKLYFVYHFPNGTPSQKRLLSQWRVFESD